MYHNEAYNSEDSTPQSERKPTLNGSMSPQRHHSFIAAVINAIKNAASTAKDKVSHRTTKLHSISHETVDGTEMLDSETEPCLMMENVLEDVSMPDTHTQNLISSAIVLPTLCSTDGDQEDSLQMLCEAIVNRQKIEEQTNLMLMKTPMPSEGDPTDGKSIAASKQELNIQFLVDHVINVDNLVTKLLKIMRIIQIYNDDCIQQLINEK